ncbi:hypothetical protein [Streptomyces luteireticuli]|uniref:Uncharacterized protein n=1 Tax=Streptomyces luteireticuli TaxID=173858 RepID=A0ABP3ITA7_9ACTN
MRRFVATAAELRLASPRGVESEFFEEFAAECDIQVLAGLDVAAEHEGSGADFDAGEGRWGGRGGSIVAGQPAPGGNRERFPPSGAGRPTRSDQAAVVRPGCPVGTVVAAKRQSPGNGSPWLGTWGSGGRFELLPHRAARFGVGSAASSGTTATVRTSSVSPVRSGAGYERQEHERQLVNVDRDDGDEVRGSHERPDSSM